MPDRFVAERCIAVALAILVAMLLLVRPHSYAASSAPSGNSEDSNRGRELFEKRCTGCHSLDGDKEGPRLRGVFGRKSASVASFKYSDGLKKANITWDADSLDKWLTDPEKFVPDNDMDFHLEKATERNDVIAYLKQLSSQ